MACSSCDEGYYLKNVNKRFYCNRSCPSKICSQCDSNNPNICLGICRTGYYLDSLTRSCHCKCFIMLECSPLCSECYSSSSSECISCKPGYLKHGTSCVITCPSGYYANINNECTQCSFTNCSVCDSSSCSIC